MACAYCGSDFILNIVNIFVISMLCGEPLFKTPAREIGVALRRMKEVVQWLK